MRPLRERHDTTHTPRAISPLAASHARRYAASGPNVTLEWANGFGHRRIVSAEPVIGRIVDFLAEDGRRIAA